MILGEEKRNTRPEHIRKAGDFDCGIENEALTEYLHGKAFEENREHKTVTYLVKLDHELIGYYSLKATGLAYIINDRVSATPLLELSEFAIDHRKQRNHLGSAIMINMVFDKVKSISEIIGCRGLITFAKSEQAIAFYESIGFEKIDEELQKILIMDDFSTGCYPMMISLDTIKKE